MSKQAVRAFTEVGGADRLSAALNVVVVLGEVAEQFDGFNHARVIERDFMVDPLVVDRRLVQTQHHVFNPVGGRPAGGRHHCPDRYTRGVWPSATIWSDSSISSSMLSGTS